MTEPTEHPLDYLPELALGVLPAEEAAAIETHLGACASCAAEYAEMARVARLLPLAAEESTPSPAVKEGLLERIAREPRVLPFGRRRPLPAWAMGAAAAGVALLLLLGGLGGFLLRGGDSAALKRDNSRQAALVQAVADGSATMARAEAGTAQAVVLHAPASDQAYTLLQGLPALPSGKAYEAWFTRDGKQFEPSTVFSDGHGVWLSAGGDIADYAVVAFTIEDSAGVSQPTAAPIIEVNLRDAARRE